MDYDRLTGGQRR